ncbi:MAG: hypothetical protein IPJ87_09500 [Flavobacteriales bacterium]|nr:hypothetical protein [Flavobacteriales bacterium]MBK9700633.1 hypothetical protein [Flavobacteriales bacterium]
MTQTGPKKRHCQETLQHGVVPLTVEEGLMKTAMRHFLGSIPHNGLIIVDVPEREPLKHEPSVQEHEQNARRQQYGRPTPPSAGFIIGLDGRDHGASSSTPWNG